jgi:hypothetical protein
MRSNCFFDNGTADLVCKSLFDIRSVFDSRQSTDKQDDITGISTVSFTGSFPQILQSLQRPSLPIQPSFRPKIVWCVITIIKPFLIHSCWLRFIPFRTIYLNQNYGAQGRCDRSIGDAYSSWAPDPTSGLPRGPCLLHSQICISYMTYEINYCSFLCYFIQKWVYTGFSDLR